jgi:putative phosphoesterase
MRIGLISDTHIPYDAKSLPIQVEEIFRGVDVILHAGDIYSSAVLDELGEIALVLAARGDDDLSSLNGRVKEKYVLNFEGFSLWLIHVFPYPNLHPLLYSSGSFSNQELEGALGEIIHEHEDIPDILVFGDTHKALLYRVQGFLFINPGSATFPNYTNELGTVAILTISHGKAEVDIIQL